MLIDFREYDSTEPFECDVCIVGGGPAGITVAKSLIDSPLNVVLLESGALELDANAALLSLYNNLGDFPMESCRARVLGGSSTHWGGASAPFGPLDMEKRDWVDFSGWPIERDDLEPYYRDAHALLELGEYTYGYPLQALGAWLPAYDSGLTERYYRKRLPPTDFGSEFRPELSVAENISIVYNAIATNIDVNPDADSVNTISFRSYDGKQGKVTARAFVISVGAMETPRLLLQSNDVQAEGLGNGADNVGRYFMYHPHANIGTLYYDSAEVALQLQRPTLGNVQFIPIVGLTEQTQIDQQLLAGSVQLLPLPNPDSGMTAMKDLAKDLRSGVWPEEFGANLMKVLGDIDGIIDDFQGKAPAAGQARMWAQTEQAPNPDNRITLSDDKDDLGQPMLTLNCQLQEIDHKTIRTLGTMFGSEAARLGLGRVQLADWVASESMTWPEDLDSGCHHLGGARMSATPEDGVVNTDCRVHGIDNLYVASSAVFPTGSDVNPTITIVALALRLTEHLRKALAN